MEGRRVWFSCNYICYKYFIVRSILNLYVSQKLFSINLSKPIRLWKVPFGDFFFIVFIIFYVENLCNSYYSYLYCVYKCTIRVNAILFIYLIFFPRVSIVLFISEKLVTYFSRSRWQQNIFNAFVVKSTYRVAIFGYTKTIQSKLYSNNILKPFCFFSKYITTCVVFLRYISNTERY